MGGEGGRGIKGVAWKRGRASIFNKYTWGRKLAKPPEALVVICVAPKVIDEVTIRLVRLETWT